MEGDRSLSSNTSGAFSAEANPAPPFRVLTAAMRWLLGVAAVLVMLAGTQLFVFAERTNEFFAWTITNPLTAATLGAAYWGSFVIETLGAGRNSGPMPASRCPRSCCSRF